MGLVVFCDIYDLTESPGRCGNPKLLDDSTWSFCALSVLYIHYTISWWSYGIDQKSQSLSGNLSLTLSVPKNEVVRLLTATDSGRIVVVRVNG